MRKKSSLIKVLIVILILSLSGISAFANTDKDNINGLALDVTNEFTITNDQVADLDNNQVRENSLDLMEIPIQTMEENYEAPVNGTLINSQDLNSVQRALEIHAGVYPALIRSGDTTKVEVYLCYNDTSRASHLRFKKLTLKEAHLLLPESTYKTFKPKSGETYITKQFEEAGYKSSVRIGSIEVPTDKDKVKVISSGLMVYYTNGGWNSYSNISGNWEMN